MKYRRHVSLLALASYMVLAGCATGIPLKTDQKVDIHKSFLMRRYQQEGKDVDLRDVTLRFKKDPQTSEKIHAFERIALLSLFPTGAGIALCGWSMVDTKSSDDMKKTRLAAGASLIGLGLFGAVVADQSLNDAFEEYNKNFEPKSTHSPWKWQILFADDRRDGVTPVLGLRAEF